MSLILVLLWLGAALTLAVLALAFAATVPLMRRREPDPPDCPANHDMPAEAVQFLSRDGLQLGGWWIPATGTPRGTVILCPGQNGSLDKDIPQAVPLQRAGFNVLLFDFRAHGCSEGALVTLGALEQADLFGALDYLESERGIGQVGVLGFSMGAGVALLVAAQDPRVRALVVDGAFPRLRGILAAYLRLRGIPGPLAGSFARVVLWVAGLRAGYSIARANPLDLAGRITAPTLFIHGERDPFVRTDEVRALAARLRGPVELWSLPDCGHRQAWSTYPDEYARRVVEWFARHLADGGALSDPPGRQ
ncbi:MAG: alpha/beta hydrolase [Anaerolineae bacterium]